MRINSKIALFITIIIGITSCESKPKIYSISSDTTALSENKEESLPADKTKEIDSRKSSSKIDSEVNRIYEDNQIKIISSTPLMDKDFKKFYSIKIHNGSNKKIIGLIVDFNFNKVSGDSINGYKIDDNKNCTFTKKIKTLINRKFNQAYKIALPDKIISCDNYPQINIVTAIFSDGTFDEFKGRPGLLGFIDESDEKEKIKKELLKKL